MPTCQQVVSVVLCAALVFSSMSLEGCKKRGQSQAGTQDEAPTATYASPTPDQLYQLVAPIALFPDNLVAQVLAASTYPDQISAAWQWLQQNSSLTGQQLSQAVDQQPWDVSVKGLTQFSDVLQQMAGNLSWTSALGDAYFNIPQSVMNAIQVMRQKAYDAGNLKTTPQQNVAVQQQPPQAAPPAPASSGESQVTVVQSPPQTIVIQPSQPEVVYVPTYNPTTVYGAPVPAYPGYSTGEMVASSLLSFGVGVMVGAAMNNSCCGWGWNSWGCGWNNASVTYNRNVYVSNSNTFVNRNNYYNRNNANYNNINRYNINRNNINANNINRNNINRNNLNNRADNFNPSSQPRFNQKYNQPQFNQARSQQLGNENRGNLAQQRGGQVNPGRDRGSIQGNQAQARPVGLNQNQARTGGLNQNQRQAQRGYGDQPSRSASNNALGNYGQGGNARSNSARGQQSLNGGGGARAGGVGGGARGGGGAGGGRETRGRGR